MINILTSPKKSISICKKCRLKGKHLRFIFQGIHTSEEFFCKKCKQSYIFDLPIGHSLEFGFYYNLINKSSTTAVKGAYSWFAKPYQKALKNPLLDEIKIKKISNRQVKKPLILNCIDYLYGHGLLKLFNIERHLDNNPDYDLVVIIPKSLLWLVPDSVAEILVVDIELSRTRNYYLSLDKQLNEYILKFKEIAISKAYSHPSVSSISTYTKQLSCIKIKNPRITFIWRGDRPWFGNIYISYAFKKLKIIDLINYLQFLKIVILFVIIRKNSPNFKYTIAGFGKKFNFPSWIDDKRTNVFTEEKERLMCLLYAESKIVIGVHGSNMLLPTAHAEMSLNIIPDDRLGNFAQDVIYEKKRFKDSRYTAFTFRYAFLNNSVITIAKTIKSMIGCNKEALKAFTLDQSTEKKQCSC